MSSAGGIVLAAGSSTRFGGDKLIQELNGRPILVHVIDAALAADLVEIVVVTGERGIPDIPPHHRLRMIPNPDHRGGIASSLKRGLEALAPALDAAVVLLGDEPEVESALINRLVLAYARSQAAALRTRYLDRVGHPVVLGRALWPELLRVEGDRGARDVLARSDDVAEMAVDRPAPIDVDTRADLVELRRRMQT